MEVINGFDIKKSSDIYDISPSLVKLSCQAIFHTLSNIFNKAIHEGCFPNAMKLAKVVPLHKGDSVLNVCNYRPISLLPIFSKIFERLIYNRLIKFIDHNQILSQLQLGFQKTNQLNKLLLPLSTEFIQSPTVRKQHIVFF